MQSLRLCIFISLCCVNLSLGKLIELNHDIGPDSPYFPHNITLFEQNVIRRGDSLGFWLAYSEISLIDSVSTHVSSPNTYNEEGRTVDNIPFWDLFAEVAAIDVRDKVSENSSYEVSVEDVEKWLVENGKFPRHCILVFVTGWDEGRYPDTEAYYGTSTSHAFSEMKYPGVSLEAIEYLLQYEKDSTTYFAAFGIDTPTLDRTPTDKFPVIHLAAKQNKYLINNLKDLKRLPATGAKIMVMPMKIENGESAPSRVAASLP